MSYLPHDPDAGPLDYSVDFASWLSTGDTVASVAWSIYPLGPTITVGTLAGSIGTTTVDGGVLGDVHRLTARVTSTNGLVDDRSIVLRVGNQ